MRKIFNFTQLLTMSSTNKVRKPSSSHIRIPTPSATQELVKQVEPVPPCPEAFLVAYLKKVTQEGGNICKLVGRTPDGTYLLQIPLSKDLKQESLITQWIVSYERRKSLRSWPKRWAVDSKLTTLEAG